MGFGVQPGVRACAVWQGRRGAGQDRLRQDAGLCAALRGADGARLGLRVPTPLPSPVHGSALLVIDPPACIYRVLFPHQPQGWMAPKAKVADMGVPKHGQKFNDVCSKVSLKNTKVADMGVL